MRSSGRLGSVDDEGFGRVPLCGGRCYLPLGFVFRRYIRHLETDTGSSNRKDDNRFMTRRERRAAVEEVLLEQSANSAGNQRKRIFSRRHIDKQQTLTKQEEATTTAQPSLEMDDCDLEDGRADNVEDDHSSCTGPLCSICLADFDSDDTILHSKTCSHQFHQVCILDWLERNHNTDCPCCRVAMVSEDEIWSIVKRKRREEKRQNKKLGRPLCPDHDDEDLSETEEYGGDDIGAEIMDGIHEEATTATDEAVASGSVNEQEAERV